MTDAKSDTDGASRCLGGIAPGSDNIRSDMKWMLAGSAWTLIVIALVENFGR